MKRRSKKCRTGLLRQKFVNGLEGNPQLLSRHYKKLSNHNMCECYGYVLDLIPTCIL